MHSSQDPEFGVLESDVGITLGKGRHSGTAGRRSLTTHFGCPYRHRDVAQLGEMPPAHWACCLQAFRCSPLYEG